MDRFEIRLSGAGGQGLILAGIILAEAISLEGKFNVVQTQSYGPEARGGASKAEVIVSSKQIAYPKVTKPDLLLSLTDKALEKYLPDLKEAGYLIIDQEVESKNIILPQKTFQIPILKVAREEIGREITGNMVALGSLVSLIDFVSVEACLKTIDLRVPKGTEEINRMAFKTGYSLITKKTANL